MKKSLIYLFCLLTLISYSYGEFVHPGVTSTKADLDRMKYMVESKIDPWYSSYQEMVKDSKSSSDYSVQGDESFTEMGRDNGVNYSEWNSDIRAAYYNAIRWYVTGDSLHAEKAIEIFKAWRNLTVVSSGGTRSLSGAICYIMIEAAEIIKSTYSGWSESDIQDFKDMLVYPGYSNIKEPDGMSRTNGSFYWQAYQGDPVRHGNQGLAGFRAVMAMGIFLDNEIMYDRALRYIQGLPHRSDDIAYPSGPSTATTISVEGEYADTYNYTTSNDTADYGFNEVMTNYIWETGQCQESSRDQSHSVFGIGNLVSMSEMAWNQGDNLYGHENDLLLKGLEYTMKYNVSYLQTYDDQTEWWIPTVESGEFMEGFNASQRVYTKAISPINIGGFPGALPIFELSVAHYSGRGFKTDEEVKWITRARDLAIDKSGYEEAGHVNNALGWGALTERRIDYGYGDPISGFDANGLPDFNMNVLPMTIEAENFDYSPINGNGRTYSDKSTSNAGGEYRDDEDVDIETCSSGFCISNMEADEWMTYTIYVPETGTYDFAVAYSAASDGGEIQFSIAGSTITNSVALSSTSGITNLTVASGILLSQGVQSLKLQVNQAGLTLLDNISISESNDCVASPVLDASLFTFIDGIKYNYYEGTWSTLPDFGSQTIVDSGIANSIGLDHGEIDDGFAYLFDGYINIDKEMDYTFYTTSDDGSDLWINGVQIVDNDGSHGAEEMSGSICLQPGYHEIQVRYFDKSGGQSLSVSYEGEGIAKQDIPVMYGEINDLVELDKTLAINLVEFSFMNNILKFFKL